MALLRTDLLEARRIAVSGDVADEVCRALVELGAELELLGDSELDVDEEQVGAWARARAPLHGLVHGAGGTFGSGGEAALLTTLDRAWAAVREVAVGALIEAEYPGKVVVLAPRSGAGPLSDAARAGLENLTRTLSVEWARYAVSAVLVAPGAGTPDSEIAMLIPFLVSEAGDYLSGCRFELGEGS
jgi:NAD(P)-dependent dehydrogenase (short-subunit alcohol dehydrogenase family)